MNPIRLQYWQFLKDNPGSSLTFNDWSDLGEAQKKERIEDNMDRVESAYQRYRDHFAGYGDIPLKDWFTHEALTNDEFCGRWAKDCTRELTYEERWSILLERDGPLGLNHDRIEQQVEKETPKRILTP
jgi:hypothetical protein